VAHCLSSKKIRELVLLLCIAAVAFAIGASLLQNAWTAFSSGEILVYPRRGAAFVAKSVGADSQMFVLHSWLRAIGGGVLTLIGVLVPLLLLLVSPVRRAQVLSWSSENEVSGWTQRAPRWLTIAVLIAVSLFLLWQVFNDT
jgi:hypothetical protein